MESIIIMVLLAVASTVFQSVVQKNKQQAEESDKTVPPVKPITQPVVKVEKAKTFTKKEPSLKGTVQAAKTKAQPAADYWESEGLMEGIQTEALADRKIPEQKNASEHVEDSSFIQDFNYNDLQRSIIMAEVLGKPKALRRSLR